MCVSSQQPLCCALNPPATHRSPNPAFPLCLHSDELDSLARSESNCSFNSWRSESELYNVFREAEEAAASDKSSTKSNTSCNGRSDTSNSNDNGSNSSSGSTNNQHGNRDANVQVASFPKLRGRYRQLGAPNHRA